MQNGISTSWTDAAVPSSGHKMPSTIRLWHCTVGLGLVLVVMGPAVWLTLPTSLIDLGVGERERAVLVDADRCAAPLLAFFDSALTATHSLARLNTLIGILLVSVGWYWRNDRKHVANEAPSN